ncbi:MAG: D-alanine--D-alanine ligase, partial [Candidatus Omnitrophota bacterium]
MMSLDGIKVGVLMGGVSPEREVSLFSGRQAALALERNSINIEEVDIVTADKDSVKELIIKKNMQIAFIALHGEFGEDGQIQAILDELDVP